MTRKQSPVRSNLNRAGVENRVPTMRHSRHDAAGTAQFSVCAAATFAFATGTVKSSVSAARTVNDQTARQTFQMHVLIRTRVPDGMLFWCECSRIIGILHLPYNEQALDELLQGHRQHVLVSLETPCAWRVGSTRQATEMKP